MDRAPNKTGTSLVRLQRVMADAGVASRRDCEALIERGHVRVNGRVVRTLPVFVDPEQDEIEVDARPLPKPQRPMYILLNKPERVLTTVDDSAEFSGTGTARTTVLDLVDHPAKPRLFPVGRLEYATRGLILLTNDGEMANRLTHPRYGVPKTYEAVVEGAVTDQQLSDLRKHIAKAERQEGRRSGRSIERVHRAEVEPVKFDGERTLLRLTLRERTSFPIRKLIVAAGCPVKRLTRVALGPLRLTGVRLGGWRELTRDELAMLRRDPTRGPNAGTASGPGARPRSGRQGGPRTRRASGEVRDVRD